MPAGSHQARPAPAPAARARARGTTPPTPTRPRRRRGSSPEQLLDLGPRPGVQHLLLRQPGAPGLADAELRIRERARRMGVAGDREQDARLAGRPRVSVAEVEPVGLGVDLEEGVRRERGLEHTPEVDIRRPAAIDLPRGQMADAVDVRILHRRHNALGRILVEGGVQRGDDPVASGQGLVVDVERPVGADVHLDPLQQPEAAESLVEGLDLAVLLLEPTFAQVVRVVGDREVRIAAALRLGRHLLDRVLAVRRPARVRVEVAAQVAQLYERRQLTLPRRFQLTEVLAQLRRDVLVAEELVDLLLAAGLEDLARLDVLYAGPGDGQPVPNGALAQGDDVVL